MCVSPLSRVELGEEQPEVLNTPKDWNQSNSFGHRQGRTILLST